MALRKVTRVSALQYLPEVTREAIGAFYRKFPPRRIF